MNHRCIRAAACSATTLVVVGLMISLLSPAIAENERKPINFTFLTDDEMSFLGQQLSPYFSRRDRDPYLGIKMEAKAVCKWLLSNFRLEPRQDIEPVIVEVLSLGDTQDHKVESMPGFATPEPSGGKRDFAFLWSRIATNNPRPAIIVTGIIRVVDIDSRETIKVIHASRRCELKDMKWVVVEASVKDVPM